MPEETEQSSEQQDTGTEETVEETAAEEQDGTESTMSTPHSCRVPSQRRSSRSPWSSPR
jgi:predicted nucleic acid-binding Zn ribbon protein